MNTIRMPFSIWQPIEPNFWGHDDEDKLANLPRRKVYEGSVGFPTDMEVQSAVHRVLEEIFEDFNIRHPQDFTGHSLSVNDVVVLGENSFRCAPMGWESQVAPREVVDA